MSAFTAMMEKQEKILTSIVEKPTQQTPQQSQTNKHNPSSYQNNYSGVVEIQDVQAYEQAWSTTWETNPYSCLIVEEGLATEEKNIAPKKSNKRKQPEEEPEQKRKVFKNNLTQT